MTLHASIYDSFDFGCIYHIYTKVSGEECIFREDKNYRFFLGKVRKYLLPVVNIHAYCLLPKQFDLLVSFRSRDEIYATLNLTEGEMEAEDPHKFLMKPFSNLLNSYAKAYNKTYHRTGSLFLDYLKRVRIDDEVLLSVRFIWIHQQPSLCGVCDFQDYRFSSYKTYLQTAQFTQLDKSFMQAYFTDMEDYIQQHRLEIQI